MHGPLRWRVAALALVAAIVVSGVVPTHETLQAVVGAGESAVATAGHFLQYAALASVLPSALRGRRGERGLLMKAGALSMALGVTMELGQSALPYRSAQLSDLWVNAAGVTFGLALVSWIGRRPAAPRPRSRRG